MDRNTAGREALERLEELVKVGRWRAVQTAGLRVAGNRWEAAYAVADEVERVRAEALIDALTLWHAGPGELVELGLVDETELVEMVAGIAEREELVAA